jgi:hypothetical protein
LSREIESACLVVIGSCVTQVVIYNVFAIFYYFVLSRKALLKRRRKKKKTEKLNSLTKKRERERRVRVPVSDIRESFYL